MELLTEIRDCARAVFSYWQSYVTGGGITALAALYEKVADRPLTRSSYLVLFLVVFVLMSFFLAWRDEHRAARQLDDQARSLIARLMALREEGVQILNRDVRGDGAILLHRAAVDGWDKQVTLRLQEARAPQSDIGRFTTLGTFPERYNVGNEMHLKYQNILAEKLERLLEIVRRLEERKT
jgi:hypothetical protein